MSNEVFSNENYVVTAGEFTSPVRSNGCKYAEGYLVTNRATGIVEFQVPQYPEAIAAAEQLDVAMETKPWEAARRFQQALPGAGVVNPDGSTPGEEEPDDETVH